MGKRKKSPSIDQSTIGISIHDTTGALIKTNLSSSTSKTQEQKRSAKNIWDEYYPLIQPVNQYHHHTGAPSYFFHGIFSSDVTCAYKDGVIAFLVALFSIVILCITALVFCKQWGIPSTNYVVFICRLLWLLSPTIASFALRISEFFFIFV
jgi:hypothetical protein